MKAENLAADQLLSVMLALFLVLGVIALLSWLAKKGPLQRMRQNSGLRLLQALPLGSREKLLLVEVSGQRILLGATAQQISTLWSDNTQSQIEETVLANDEVSLVTDLNQNANAQPAFADRLKQLMNQKIAC